MRSSFTQPFRLPPSGSARAAQLGSNSRVPSSFHLILLPPCLLGGQAVARRWPGVVRGGGHQPPAPALCHMWQCAAAVRSETSRARLEPAASACAAARQGYRASGRRLAGPGLSLWTGGTTGHILWPPGHPATGASLSPEIQKPTKPFVIVSRPHISRKLPARLWLELAALLLSSLTSLLQRRRITCSFPAGPQSTRVIRRDSIRPTPPIMLFTR